MPWDLRSFHEICFSLSIFSQTFLSVEENFWTPLSFKFQIFSSELLVTKFLMQVFSDFYSCYSAIIIFSSCCNTIIAIFFFLWCSQGIAFCALVYLLYYLIVGVFQSPILGPALFTIFTCDTQWDMLSAPSASLPVTPSWVVANSVERRDIIQEHLDGFEEWAHMNLRNSVKPSKRSCTQVTAIPNTKQIGG